MAQWFSGRIIVLSLFLSFSAFGILTFFVLFLFFTSGFFSLLFLKRGNYLEQDLFVLFGFCKPYPVCRLV